MRLLTNSISKITTCPRLITTVCIVVSMLAAFASVSQGQDDSRLKLWVHGSDFKDLNNSMIYVSAILNTPRPGEEPIMGYSPLKIDANGFQVFVNNKPIESVNARSFEDSEVALDAVLVIDVSGSVYPNYEFVKQGVAEYVGRRREGKDQICIITFGATVKKSQFGSAPNFSPFTGDTTALEQFINVPPDKMMRSGTVLFKAMVKAVQVAVRGRSNPGKAKILKTLFVFSDGDDQGTGFFLNDSIRIAKEERIPVFTLGLPQPAEKNRHHDNLKKIADKTGGMFFQVDDLARLQGVFERLDYILKNEYVLSFQLPVEYATGAEHPVKIQAEYRGETMSKEIVIRPPFVPEKERKRIQDAEEQKRIEKEKEQERIEAKKKQAIIDEENAERNKKIKRYAVIVVSVVALVLVVFFGFVLYRWRRMSK